MKKTEIVGGLCEELLLVKIAELKNEYPSIHKLERIFIIILMDFLFMLREMIFTNVCKSFSPVTQNYFCWFGDDA